jgi:uncharacterized protein (TIGR00299 family) protein
MRIAYFDCFSGFAGDMALGALVDAGLAPAALERALAPLGLAREFALRFETVRRGPLAATKAHVDVLLPERERVPRTLYDVETLIAQAGLAPEVAARATAVFRRLARAEAAVHGTSIEAVHFHEVGAIDAIVDVCGTCAGLALLGVETVYASEATVGRGTIRSAHGEIPAPGPAVLHLLEGVPLRARDVGHELTTPTGAALLAELAKGFGPIPRMTLRSTGTGAGDADFPSHPNVCRVLLGDAPGEPAGAPERVLVLEANLDDLSPQLVAAAVEAAFAAGALDAFTLPCFMKKGRPGVLLTALCREEDAPALEAALFRETTTFGVRRHACDRAVLAREIVRAATPMGEVEVKLGRLAGRVVTATPEFESVKRLAQERGLPFRQVHEAAVEAAARLRG